MLEKFYSFKSWEDSFKFLGHFSVILLFYGIFLLESPEFVGQQVRNIMVFYLFFIGARSMNDENLSEKETFQYLKEDSWVIPVIIISFILGFFLL